MAANQKPNTPALDGLYTNALYYGDFSPNRVAAMADLRDRLSGFLVSDGAMGTQLFAQGLEGHCPEIWNVDRPDAIAGIHRAYLDAGSQIILTNTFGATEWKLDRSAHAADQERLCRAAAEIALAAIEGRDAFVMGDVGPTGELPHPLGPRRITEFEAVFATQIDLLAKAGVHGILIESMANAQEAAAAIRAARRTCDLPVVGSVTYAAGKRGYRSMMGETVAQATRSLLDAEADVVGSNCGLGAGQMAEVIAEIKAVTDRPVWAKPNAGRPELIDGKTVFQEDAETWAAKVPAILEAGANIVGGCCGTGPEHIARARQLIAK